MSFEEELIPPIHFLAELREEVLKHSLKRMPKWKFRLASDLVLQLQPKPTVLLSEAATARGFKPKLQHFEGVAVMTEGITGAVFKHLPRRPCPPGGRSSSSFTLNLPTKIGCSSALAGAGSTAPSQLE